MGRGRARRGANKSLPLLLHLGSVAATGGSRGNEKLGLILPPKRQHDRASSSGFRKKPETLGRTAQQHLKGDQLIPSTVCAPAVQKLRDLSGCRKREMAFLHPPWPLLSFSCKVETAEETSLSHLLPNYGWAYCDLLNGRNFAPCGHQKNICRPLLRVSERMCPWNLEGSV